MPAVAETKRPQGYAFGPLPLKSFGDVIGHASRGLYGMVIVEPKGTQQARIVNGALTYTAIPTAVASSSVRLRYPQAAHPGSSSPDADPGHQDGAVTLPSALVSEHALVWQDGLTLHAPRIGGGGLAPVADCHVCDDSYDFGKRGVSYRAGMLTARLGIPAITQMGEIASTVNGAFDLNKIVIPKSIYSHTVKALHLPPLVSQPGDEVMFRLLHPAGRARQRAFVMTGAGYDDLFPGFGFPSAALLAPGKALTAHLWRKAAAGECQLWRDGPSLMVGQGVWGLHGVPSTPQGTGCMRETMKSGAAVARMAMIALAASCAGGHLAAFANDEPLVSPVRSSLDILDENRQPIRNPAPGTSVVLRLTLTHSVTREPVRWNDTRAFVKTLDGEPPACATRVRMYRATGAVALGDHALEGTLILSHSVDNRLSLVDPRLPASRNTLAIRTLKAPQARLISDSARARYFLHDPDTGMVERIRFPDLALTPVANADHAIAHLDDKGLVLIGARPHHARAR